MKKLKWYNYAAKVVLITIMLSMFPILVLFALADGEHPLVYYKFMWTGKLPNS